VRKLDRQQVSPPPPPPPQQQIPTCIDAVLVVSAVCYLVVFVLFCHVTNTVDKCPSRRTTPPAKAAATPHCTVGFRHVTYLPRPTTSSHRRHHHVLVLLVCLNSLSFYTLGPAAMTSGVASSEYFLKFSLKSSASLLTSSLKLAEPLQLLAGLRISSGTLEQDLGTWRLKVS